MAMARQSVFLRRICRWERQSGQKLGVFAAIFRNPSAVAEGSVPDALRFVDYARCCDATKHRHIPLLSEDGSGLSRHCLRLGKPGQIGADERTRTFTPIKEQRPQRCASTNSATSASIWLG